MISLFSIDETTLNHSLATIRSLTDSKTTQSKEKYEFKSFEIANHESKLAAVDGSNHNISGVNFIIAALRAGYLIYQDGELIEDNISKIRLETLINSNGNIGYQKIYKDYYYELTGEVPEEHLEFDKVSERLRTIMEWKYITDLVNKLEKGDIIIFDGSLISGAISTNHLYFETLVSKAKDRGISLVGLSKDTSLSINDVPIPSILREAAKEQAKYQNWYVSIEDTYFVKFTRDIDLIFRFDVVYPDETTIEEILSKLGAYAFSTRTLGYPYPMQRIHDEVRISQLDKDNCFSMLKNQWIQKSNSQNSQELRKVISEFNELFFNYHKQLDLISSGR
jgi:hypothetical protein